MFRNSQQTGLLALCFAALAFAACEDEPAPPTRADAVTAKPSAGPTPVTTTTTSSARPKSAPKAETSAPAPSASAITSAVASAVTSAAPVAPVSFLAAIAPAGKLKIRRFAETGGVDAETELTDAKLIEQLLAAIDLKQEPKDSCPSCVHEVQIVFNDAYATRLGTMGLFCRGSDNKDEAAIKDALENRCMTVKLKDATALRKIVDEALGKPAP